MNRITGILIGIVYTAVVIMLVSVALNLSGANKKPINPPMVLFEGR